MCAWRKAPPESPHADDDESDGDADHGEGDSDLEHGGPGGAGVNREAAHEPEDETGNAEKESRASDHDSGGARRGFCCHVEPFPASRQSWVLAVAPPHVRAYVPVPRR